MTSDATNRFDSDALDREERDALVSAYALGELDGAERAFVERLLADPAATEARRIVAESSAVAAALRAARAADVPPRSADLRRAVVAAIADAGRPAAPTPAARSPRAGLSGWFALAGALAATALVAVTILWSPPAAREVARKSEKRQADARSQGKIVRRAAEEARESAAPPAAQVPPAQPNAAAVAASGEHLKRLAANAAPEAGAAAAAPAEPASDGRPEAESVVDMELVEEEPMPRDFVGHGRASATVKSFGGAATALAGPSGGGNANGLGGRAAALRSAAAGGGEADRSLENLRRGAAGADADAMDKPQATDRERYGRFEENRFTSVADRPLSTFSIDVDTASYAVARRFLAAGRLPPADAVRIEEFVNYFSYAYPEPAGDDPFAVALEAADCPWHAGHRLVRIGIAGRDIDRAKRPAGNLVFLVDVSGSMDDPDKLPLVKQALALLVQELTENDRVSIVTYAGDAGLKLPPTSGDQKRKILDVIEGLSAGGSTHGSAGIVLAYDQARERFIPGGANRVILCTDGDLNVGVTSDAALVDLVQQKARGGTFLTVLGFGQGNLQDEKLEAIADKGNGVYAYVDGVREARKVLVEQLTGSTITIAKDVKIQVEFNPAEVASYRLIGYENRRLADADFRDDRKDAGEIGAGHTVTALYEIVPAAAATAGGDGPGPGAEPLKYQAQPEKPRAAEPPAGPANSELLTVKLRFKQPEGDASVLREFPLADKGGGFDGASADTRFAGAVAAFGMILRSSEFKGDATLATVAKIAGDALGPDAGGYRAEFLDLVRRAETLHPADIR